MSDAVRSLRRQARELASFLQDLQECEQVPLDEPVSADRSVGVGTKVTHWVLIEHFLMNLVEWNDLHTNYLRYSGRTEESRIVSDRLWKRMGGCNELSREFAVGRDYADLPERLRMSWTSENGGTTEIARIHREEQVLDAEALFQEVVQYDLRVRTASVESWQGPGVSSSKMQSVLPPNSGWRTLVSELEDSRKTLRTMFIDAGPEPLDEVRFYLRNYRYATMRLSWLEPKEQDGGKSFLFELHRDFRESELNIGQFLEEVRKVTNGNAVPLADQVLTRITSAISEVGYANFVKDVTDPDFVGGQDSPLGWSDINVIPGSSQGACHPMLVAITRGPSRQGKLGFPVVMDQMKQHLSDCAGITKVVVVLTNSWNTKSFMQDHYDDLRAFHRDGVRYLFLLIGAPNTSLSVVNVQF